MALRDRVVSSPNCFRDSEIIIKGNKLPLNKNMISGHFWRKSAQIFCFLEVRDHGESFGRAIMDLLKRRRFLWNRSAEIRLKFNSSERPLYEGEEFWGTDSFLRVRGKVSATLMTGTYTEIPQDKQYSFTIVRLDIRSRFSLSKANLNMGLPGINLGMPLDSTPTERQSDG